MRGEFEWRTAKLHDDIPEEAIWELGQEFWDVYFDVGPHFGLLVVAKGSSEDSGAL